VFTVIEEHPWEETIGLTDLAGNRLDALAASTELDPKVRQAMTELAAKRRAIDERRGELDRLNQERTRLVADETRLRDNLSALGRETGLRKRLLDSFAATENQIETVTAEIGKASAGVDMAERDLSSYIAGLNL
jgi:chromosome segregation ATPase